MLDKDFIWLARTTKKWLLAFYEKIINEKRLIMSLIKIIYFKHKLVHWNDKTHKT